MNSDLFNAIREGGPRNGVLTGVEDYLQTTAADWHFVTLPLYYGLGILAPEQRLQRNRALREHLQHFTLDAPARKLLGLAEHLRCTDGIMLQAIHSQLERAHSRIAYLESQLEANHTKG